MEGKERIKKELKNKIFYTEGSDEDFYLKGMEDKNFEYLDVSIKR